MEISRIAISCSFPRSPSPLGHPEPCSWGLSGSSGAPGLSWGRRGAHASATPEPLSPVLRSGPTCSTGLGFLAEAGPCSPQPPGSPRPSSWNVPGVSLLQAPQETGHFLHPRSTRCARNPRANQARGRPCAEVPRWGLDAHGRSCRGGRGRTTGSASGPRAQTPELPHRQRFTADPARVAPGLAPPPQCVHLPQLVHTAASTQLLPRAAEGQCRSCPPVCRSLEQALFSHTVLTSAQGSLVYRGYFHISLG